MEMKYISLTWMSIVLLFFMMLIVAFDCFENSSPRSFYCEIESFYTRHSLAEETTKEKSQTQNQDYEE